jgi:hypothetical protein
VHDLFFFPRPRRHCAALLTFAKPSWTAGSGPSPTTSTTPWASHRRVRPPRTVSYRPPPRTPPPTAVPFRPTTPHRRAHSSGELLPARRPKMGPPPYRLAPRTLPTTPRRRPPPKSCQAATSAAVAERPPLSPLRRATSPSGWASPKQAGQFRPVCTVQPAIFPCD